MPNQEFIAKMKERLLAEKSQVEEKISKYSKIESNNSNVSEEDLAQEATEQMLGESITEVHKNILERINLAIAKIENNTYGRCEQCAAEISERDLEKEPWTEHCSVCSIKK